MFVRSDGRGGFESLFPRVPKEYGPDGDRSLKVLSEEPYIARTQGRALSRGALPSWPGRMPT